MTRANTKQLFAHTHKTILWFMAMISSQKLLLQIHTAIWFLFLTTLKQQFLRFTGITLSANSVTFIFSFLILDFAPVLTSPNPEYPSCFHYKTVYSCFVPLCCCFVSLTGFLLSVVIFQDTALSYSSFSKFLQCIIRSHGFG